jgi:hypothetical protein
MGFFGYFKLMDWYHNEFSTEEKESFKKAYGNGGMWYPFDRLASREESYIQGRGPVDLLTTILHKIIFKNNYPVDITVKVANKLHSLIGDQTAILEKHFAYLELIKLYKKQMSASPDYEAQYVQACLDMVSIAKEARTAFESDGDGRLPNNRTFHELSDYYHSKKMFKEAAWIEEQSIKLWGVSVGIDYEGWVEQLIEQGNKPEAQRVFDLLVEEYGDEEEWQAYKESIAAL